MTSRRDGVATRRDGRMLGVTDATGALVTATADTTDTIVRLGGVAQTETESSTPLVAITYRGAALGDRPVVRLSPEPVRAVEDATLAMFDLIPDPDAPVVGHTRMRALGFPALPIVMDPANARHALNLVGDLRRISQVAAARPGAARDIATKIGARLGESAPHFLPTFYEEVARRFTAADRAKFATQFVGKAREAERVHNLQIDPERHSLVMLEFALAGTLSIKDLTAEARDLPARVGPEQAYALFHRLSVERVRGGMPPYANVLTDLARLAKGAGVSGPESARRFLSQIIDSPAIRTAHIAFWQKAAPALKALVQQDDAARDAVLDSIPRVSAETWVGILQALGLLEYIDAHPEVARRQVALLVSKESATRFRGRVAPSPVIPDIIDRWAAALAGHTIVLTEKWLRPDSVEALLAAGAEFAAPEGWTLQYDHWAKSEHRRDLLRIAQSLRDRVVADLDRNVMHLRDADSATPAVVYLLAEWLRHQLELPLTLATAIRSVGHVTELSRGRAFALLGPEVAALQAHLDPAVILAGELRRGLTTELTWPLYEQVMAAARHRVATRPQGTAAADVPLSVSLSWPAVGVGVGDTVTLIAGSRVLAEHTFPGRLVLATASIGTDILASVYDATKSRWFQYSVWASDPVTPHDGHWASYLSSLYVPEGRLYANGIQAPGADLIVTATDLRQTLLTDGTTFWVTDGDGVREFDPDRGRPGRASMPTWLAEVVEAQARDGWQLEPATVTYRPVMLQTAQSMISTADRHHGFAGFRRADDTGSTTWRLVDVKGAIEVEIPRHRSPLGIVARPGGGFWVLTGSASGEVMDGSGEPIPATVDEFGLPGAIEALPPMAWHMLTARDEAASGRLRQVTPAQAGRLLHRLTDDSHPATGTALADATAWRHNSAADCAPGTKAIRAAADIIGVDHRSPAHRPLLVAMVQLARRVAANHVDVQDLRRAPAPPPAPPQVYRIPAVDIVTDNVFQWSQQSVQQIAGLWHRRIATLTQQTDTWPQTVGWEAALLATAGAPTAPRGAASAAISYLDHLLTNDLGTDGVATVEIKGKLSVGWFTPTTFSTTPTDILLTATALRYWVGTGLQASSHALVRGRLPETVCGQVVLGASPLPRRDVRALRGALQALADRGPAPFDPSRATALAAATGMSVAAASLLLGGAPNFGSSHRDFLGPEALAVLGLTEADADVARRYLNDLGLQLRRELLAAAVPADPHRFVTDGPDVAAMIATWRRHRGETAVPHELVAAIDVRLHGRRPILTETLTAIQHRQLAMHEPGFAVQAMILLAGLAETLPLESPLRSWTADKLDDCRAAWLNLGTIPIRHDSNHGVDHGVLRQQLGLPPQVGTIVDGPYEVGEFRLSSSQSRTDRLELVPARVTDWAATLTRITDLDPDPRQRLEPLQFFLGEPAAELSAWLRTPGTGSPSDPAASAPGVVAAVAAGLDIPPDTARYWLQLAALPHPSDAAVKRINSWTTKHLRTAAAPLLDKGLAMSAKRPRAGRDVFLPGGWLPADAPHPPMEVWKARFYALRPAPKVQPISNIVLPLTPLSALFADAWQRYADGDTPGYEELRTEPYRRRRR